MFTKDQKKFSSDKTTAIELLKYLLNDLEEKKFQFRNIVYLQPTSPFRNFSMINKAINTYRKSKKIDSLISVCKVESFHPARMKFMDKNNILFDNYYTEKKRGFK